jgi:hypothetical protein
MDLRFIFSTLAGFLAAAIIFAMATTVRHMSKQSEKLPAISRTAGQ